jgi:hypothetical protein
MYMYITCIPAKRVLCATKKEETEIKQTVLPGRVALVLHEKGEKEGGLGFLSPQACGTRSLAR